MNLLTQILNCFLSFTSGDINKFNLINSDLKKRHMKIKMILKKN